LPTAEILPAAAAVATPAAMTTPRSQAVLARLRAKSHQYKPFPELAKVQKY